MEDLFAGLDVSTQGQKIVIIDLEKRSVIYSDSINYDVDLPKYSTLNGVLKDTDIGVFLNPILICGLIPYISFLKD